MKVSQDLVMYPVTLIEPESGKSDVLKVDIVFLKKNQKRKFLGLERRPSSLSPIEVYCYRYYQKGSKKKHYHLSRHGSGRMGHKIQGEGDFYPLKNGELGARLPSPFRIDIAEPERPPLENMQGVEQLSLYDPTGLWEFFNPEASFQDCSGRKSDADYQFTVEIEHFMNLSQNS
jgi:hypothetical protein